MFAKTIHNVGKLYRLLAAGEYRRLINAAKLRLDRLVHGAANSQRTEVERHQQELARVLRKHFECDNTYREDTTNVALILRGGSIMPQSSAFIRLIAPLTHPAIREAVSVKLYPENTVSIDTDTDVCIVQRTAFDSTRAARRLTKHLDRHGIPLVLDTDDAFSMLENHHSQYREQSGRVKGMKHILGEADRVWISTDILAELYGNQAHHTVVPNTLDARVWQTEGAKRPVPAESTAPLQLVCMGTATHDDDLEMIMPALEEIAREYPGTFELTLIGVTDGMVEKPWLKRIRQPKFGAMYPNFVQWFLKQGPFDIGLSPLQDTEFNRSKSDIKCLDYLAAGILPLVSDVTPYQEGVSPYTVKVPNTHEHWVRCLKEYVTDPETARRHRNDTVQQAQDYIWNSRSSEQTARILQHEIEALRGSGD